MMTTINLERIAHDLGPILSDGVEERDHSAAFVHDSYTLLKHHKVFLALVPVELGGGGASHGEMCAFVRSIARHCPSTALSLAMHQHLVAAATFNYRNGRPGQKLLEKVVAGETVLTSTGANDWLESSGFIERTEGGYLVTARKPFGSGSPAGEVMVTSAPYEDPEHGWQVLHFAVPFAAEGVSLAGDWDTLGMRATGSQTIVLDRVFVADEAISLRRPRGAFHPAWNIILTVALPLIMQAYVGLAEDSVETAIALASRRKDDPAAPFFLGELSNNLTAAQLAADDMVRIANDLDFEASLETTNAIVMRKTLAANAVLDTVAKAMECSGGAGFYRRNKLERLFRDAQAVQFHPLQEKRQHHFTGRMAMGLEPIEMDDVPAMRRAA